jgi:ribose 5-phosphate isomerase A
MSLLKAKDAAGFRALDYLKEGMTIGLGTGSTASHFIQHLIDRCESGFEIRAVATSLISEEMARKGGIPIADINAVSQLDLTVDGADEVDPEKRLIKGAGGALVWEKIVAAMSQKMVVIVDSTKSVQVLGGCPLPVEVIPFGLAATQAHIQKLGLSGKFRQVPDGHLYTSDNHNYIFDITFQTPPANPEELNEQLLKVPGVVDTGFFFNLASTVIVGSPDGTTTIIE